MKTVTSKWSIVFYTIICACMAGFVDGILQPPYFVRAGLKAALFSLIPLLYLTVREKSWKQIKALLMPKIRDLLIALAMGLGVYAVILGAYWLFTRFVDITQMLLELTADAGVRADNFLLVSLYISLVNSFMEEFLFRGFAFLTLKQPSSRKFAYIFSALVFSLYHFGMMAAGNIWISILALIGLFIGGCLFNWLDERSGTIITSWLVHMFANFAINTIAFKIFGMI